GLLPEVMHLMGKLPVFLSQHRLASLQPTAPLPNEQERIKRRIKQHSLKLHNSLNDYFVLLALSRQKELHIIKLKLHNSGSPIHLLTYTHQKADGTKMLFHIQE